MAEEQKASPMTAVQVTNISPNATEKTVADFFSFCGKINKLYVNKEEGQETSTAVVEFETESAAKTALLLTNALIVDRPIVVLPVGAPVPEGQPPVDVTASPQNRVSHDQIPTRDFGGVSDETRSKTSVVASLIAAGYVLASDALHKAKHYDEEHNITLQLKVGVEQMKVKAHEFDKTYGISEKAESVKKSASDKAKQIDEDYKISERASAAATSVKNNPTVQTGVASVKAGWTNVSTTVGGYYTEYKSEVDKAIEEKQRQKIQGQVPGGTEEQKKEAEEETIVQPDPQ